MTDYYEIPDFLNRNKDKSMTGAPTTTEPTAPVASAPTTGDRDLLPTMQKTAAASTPKAPRQKRTAAFKITVEGYIAYDDTDPADMARVASLVAEKDAAKLASAMSGVTVSHTHGRFKGIA